MKYHASRKKQILLAITGMSPQVVTETLYGIHCNQQPWPDEIHVITTAKGKEQARLGLITAKQNNLTMIEQCCADYQRDVPLFNETHIHVIPDQYGREVDDARTHEDQAALADFIVKAVAQLCDDKLCVIHASIAGGRKTMTFYLGYAMALFARDDDCLSHVLVDDAYEGLRDFYYPTPYTHSIAGRNVNDQLDAMKATVMLADIPFIRHRGEIDNFTLSMFANSNVLSTPSCGSTLRYNELVALLNVAKYPEKYLDACSIRFELALQQVRLCLPNQQDVIIDFSGAKLELAFYAMVARQSHDQGIRIGTPIGGDEKNQDYGYLFINELLRMEQCCESDIANLTNMTEQLAQFSVLLDRYSRTVDGFYNQPLPASCRGLEEDFFSDRKTKLKALLQASLPQKVAALFLPAGVYHPEGYRASYYTGRNKPNFNYGVWVHVQFD